MSTDGCNSHHASITDLESSSDPSSINIISKSKLAASVYILSSVCLIYFEWLKLGIKNEMRKEDHPIFYFEFKILARWAINWTTTTT